MSKHVIGEYIALNWDDGEEEVYVCGHVDPDDFRAIVAAYHDWGLVPVPGEPSEGWAAYRFDGQDEYGNPRRILRTYAAKGRGMWPVTYAEVVRWDVVPPEEPHQWSADHIAACLERYTKIADFRNRRLG